MNTYRSENEERVIRDTKIITLPTASKSFWVKIIAIQLFIVFVIVPYKFKPMSNHICLIEDDTNYASSQTQLKVVMTNTFWFDTTIASQIDTPEQASYIRREICENNIKSLK